MFLKFFILFSFATLKIRSQTLFGFKNYIEWEKGNINIIISSPHDGYLKPDSIPDRTPQDGTSTIDFNTRIVTQSLANELSKLFSLKTGSTKKPFVLYNNLHRIKLDPNRDNIECCSSAMLATDALITHSQYHQVISENFTKNFVLNGNHKYQQALLIDIHGQSHPEDWVEIGYGIPNNVLNSPLSNMLDCTIKTLQSNGQYSLDNLIRGNAESLGSFFQKETIKTVPSPANPSPLTGNYFSGGYTVRTHGKTSNRLNAIQIEFPYSMRKNSTLATRTGVLVAKIIFDYYNFHGLEKLIN